MAEDSGDKSLEPTPHRRQQVRAEGQVARSQDLNSAGMLLGSLLVLVLTGGAPVEFLAGFLGSYLSGETWMVWVQSGRPVDGELVTSQWNALLPGLTKVLLPVLAFVALLTIALNLLQVGFLFLPHKLLPDFARVDPLAGLARLFSLGGAMRLVFGIFKISVVIAVAVVSLYGRRNELVSLADHDLPQIAVLAWDLCFWTCVKIGGALFALAVLDYGYQRWKYEQDLKMTPQEMREEMRNLQGDPQILARRRSVQQQSALSRLALTVPRADVVIAKSPDLAVALRYDADSMQAPVVVAKGAGVIAVQIQRLAVEHGIPLVEKHLLAQELYQQVDLNRAIGDKLYAAVAEVLAYAYQRQSKPIPTTRG